MAEEIVRSVNKDNKVSFVILSYNRCVEVLYTIDKLKAYKQLVDFNYEIIVVDNASVDDTSKQINKLHPDVTLIRIDKNNGIAGWNEGFKAAKSEYFFVLDDDSHIYSGLAESIAYMDSHPETGVLAMETMDEDLQMDKFLNLEDAWKDGDKVAGFIGCGALIRKELYDKIGGYADWIYLYTHEFEFGIRCLQAGYDITFFGKGIVIHRVSKLNRLPKRMRIFATRNEMAIISKYFAKDKTKYILRVLLNNLKFIKREGLLTAWYVIGGAFEFLKIRSKIGEAPVSMNVQNFYAENFWSTKPVFYHLKRRFFK